MTTESTQQSTYLHQGQQSANQPTRQPALIFTTSQPNATFLGVHTQGATTPKFELGRHFCTMHLRKFHHPMFTRSEVIMLTNEHTNKQTDAAENI